jgi:PHP family Zn ribbon phosphoesterase
MEWFQKKRNSQEDLLEKEEYQKKREHYQRLDNYHERNTQIGNSRRNHVCLDCRKTFKKEFELFQERKCPNCGGVLQVLGLGARVPRIDASDRKWKAFAKKFYLDKSLFR